MCQFPPHRVKQSCLGTVHYIQKNSQEEAEEEASVKEEEEEVVVCTKWQLPKWANVSALVLQFGLIAPREEGRQMVQQQQQQH